MRPDSLFPKPFLEYDPQFYDSYMELNYALFFLTQTVVEGIIARGKGGSIVNIGSMWAHQAIGLTPSSGHSMQKAGLHALSLPGTRSASMRWHRAP
jgi:NAD(P)-dependent dehydrogenase (short-subunit alcohol dehydrogenase family)